MTIILTGMIFWPGCDDEVPVNSENDTERPSVSISEPVNGSIIRAPTLVEIKAIASDNNRVSRVDFYLDNSLFSSDDSSPYQAWWSVTKLMIGNTYTWSARAFDPAGNMRQSAEIMVSVSN